MNTATLRKLALYAALALTPALVSAQTTSGDTKAPATGATTAPATGGATMPAPAADKMKTGDDAAYQKELSACDSKPATERDACKAAADQKFNKKSDKSAPTTGMSDKPAAPTTGQASDKAPAKSTY